MSEIISQTYVVCFHDDGHIEAATPEEYRARLDYFKFRTDDKPGFYCLYSVDAVNRETAVAIAMTYRLNEGNRVGTLLADYLSENHFLLDSLDKLSPAAAKDLDRLLSVFSEEGWNEDQKSIFDGRVELINPCRWNPDEYESEWVSPKDKPLGAVEVATPNGRHRAWCREQQDIPRGWVMANTLPSPGQLSLI